MKKALSIILSLVMVIGLIPMTALPAFAEEATASTNAVINVYDKVVPTTDATGVLFTSLLGGKTLAADTTYKLMEDIDLSGVTLNKQQGEMILSSGVVFDGNGKAIKNITLSKGQDVGLFKGHTSGTVTIKDVAFGTKDAPMVFDHDGSAYHNSKAFALIIGTESNATTNFTNVSAYVTANYTAGAWQDMGVFVARNWGTLNFTNCVVDGSISANGYVGAYVGYARNKSVTFTNCVNNANVTAKNTQNYGGFIGFVDNGTAVSFTGCVNNGDVSGVNVRYAGGFIGQYKSTGALSFTNCVNNGDITQDKSDGLGAGGFVGCADAKTTISITSSKNTGNITGYPAAGGFVGNLATAGTTLNATNSVNMGDVNATGGHAGGFVGKVDITSATITVNGFYGAGNITSTSSAGGVVGRAEVSGNNGVAITINDLVQTGNVTGKWNAGAATGYVKDASLTVKNSVSTATTAAGNQNIFANYSTSAVTSFENNCYLNDANNNYSNAVKKTLAEIVDVINANETVVGAFGRFTADSEGTGVVVSTPEYEGYQLGAIDENNKYSVRFVATINDVKLADPCEYAYLGMEFSFDGGKTFVANKTVSYVYTSILGTDSGNQISYTAEALGGKYIYAVIADNIDASKELNVVVRTMAEDQNGNRYYGKAYTVVVPATVAAN